MSTKKVIHKDGVECITRQRTRQDVFFLLIGHRQKRVEPLGGRDFLYLETISNISWKTVPQIAEMIHISPRTVHLETISDTPARGTIHALI